MSALTQIAAVSAMNLRSLPQRIGTSSVVVIGIAGVVAVLISVLAMSTGFIRTAAPLSCERVRARNSSAF
jgi:putative ABC transport system permease protein